MSFSIIIIIIVILIMIIIIIIIIIIINTISKSLIKAILRNVPRVEKCPFHLKK